jgi:hypothetical protein
MAHFEFTIIKPLIAKFFFVSTYQNPVAAVR